MDDGKNMGTGRAGEGGRERNIPIFAGLMRLKMNLERKAIDIPSPISCTRGGNVVLPRSDDLLGVLD